MNLKTHIRTELWLAISNTYEAENYSHAILDAMHYLSNVLREKAGIDGDGASLVGQALGGSSPRLRINRLQTQTERNVQGGIEQILRGLYQAIRNPRSHEQVEDSKDTADAIVYFINYVLNILDASEEPFTIPKFLSRVFDPDFVESERYATLLGSDIPTSKRLDVLIEIYRKKSSGDGTKLRYIVRAILDDLSDDQITDFLTVVSEELKTTHDDSSIRITLQILPPQMWSRIDEVARLRTENKMIKSIEQGQMDYRREDRTRAGALGTWARDFLQHFTLRNQVAQVFLSKLESDSKYVRDYIANYFMSVLPHVISGSYERRRCIRALSKAIRNEDRAIKQQLAEFLSYYPSEWREEILGEFQDITDPENPEFYLADGTPFLKAENGYDEIPF